MKNDEPFDVKGYWWLPGKEESAAPGILYFDPSSGASLELIGSLRTIFDEGEVSHANGTTTVKVSAESSAAAGTYPRIYGRTVDGAEYTLDSCFATHTRGPGFGVAVETIRVNVVVAGAHLDSMMAEGFLTGLQYLPHWMDLDGFEESRLDERSATGQMSYTINLREFGRQAATLADGATVALIHRAGTEGNQQVRTLRQYHWFNVRYDSEREVGELIGIASDMQDLVSIATGRSAAFHGVTLNRSDVRRLSMAGTDHGELPMKFFSQWTVKDTSKKPGELDRHDLYFSYTQLGGIEGVSRWLNTAGKHREALGRLMSSKYSREMFTSDRILNRAVALQALHATETSSAGQKISARERLEWCLTRAGSEFEQIVGTDTKSWLDAVIHCRNDAAHHEQRSKGDTADLHHLAESLYWLFIICMLRISDAPAEVFDSIGKNQETRWREDKIRAAIMAVLGSTTPATT